MLVEIELVPNEVLVKGGWKIYEDKSLTIEIQSNIWLEVIRDYIYIKIQEVPFGFEDWITREDTFFSEGEQWGIFKKETWAEVGRLKEKIPLDWKYVPTAVQAEEGWEKVKVGEVEKVYFEKGAYERLRKRYSWVRLTVVPQVYRNRGQRVIGENCLIFEKRILATIYRKHHSKG